MPIRNSQRSSEARLERASINRYSGFSLEIDISNAEIASLFISVISVYKNRSIRFEADQRFDTTSPRKGLMVNKPIGIRASNNSLAFNCT